MLAEQDLWRRRRLGSTRAIALTGISPRVCEPQPAPAYAIWRKRPQTSSALKFRARSDETSSVPQPIRGEPMSLSVSPAQPRNERQLVFTSSQAARYVGVSLAPVRRWTDAGHIDCYRTPGGQRRFSRPQLDEFIASMQRTGPAEEPATVEHRGAQVA